MSPRTNPLRRRGNGTNKVVNLHTIIACLNTGENNLENQLKNFQKSHPNGDGDNNLSRTIACYEAKIMAVLFLKEARDKAGITQFELTKLLGLKSQAYISKAESINSKMKVPLDFLVRVSHATNYPLVLAPFRGVAKPTESRKKALDTLLAQIPQDK